MKEIRMSLSVNGYNPNFKGNESIQDNKATQLQQNDTATATNPIEDKEQKKSNKDGILIGLGALGVTVIGGLLLKKHIDAKALVKEANAKGFEDIEAYKKVKDLFNDIKKYDKVSYEDIYGITKKVFKNVKHTDGDELAIFSPEQTKEMFKNKITGKLPDNAFAITYTRGENVIHTELINSNEMQDDLHDLVDDAWNAGKIFIKKISIK